jgi:uncharacterized membrane protein HdeD (DUF308 family)
MNINVSNQTYNWWALVLRGAVSVLFGLMAIVWPDITLGALIILFGAYAVVDGAFAIASGIREAGDQSRWWLTVIEGIVSIGAGVIAFVWPDLTALALLYIIAFWAIFTGVLEVVAAVRLREIIDGEWLLGLMGLLSIMFGILLVAFPGSGALALIWLIGMYAIAFGVVLIALGLRVRSLEHAAA